MANTVANRVKGYLSAPEVEHGKLGGAGKYQRTHPDYDRTIKAFLHGCQPECHAKHHDKQRQGDQLPKALPNETGIQPVQGVIHVWRPESKKPRKMRGLESITQPVA